MGNGYRSSRPTASAAPAKATGGNAIDRLLRDYFTRLQSQPIPEEMRSLIDRLDRMERGGGGGRADRGPRQDCAAL